MAHIKCSGDFVDCSENGGYDPRDPCNQTCVQKKEEKGQKKVDEATDADTTQAEVSVRTKTIIFDG